jgi:hypothetical protein
MAEPNCRQKGEPLKIRKAKRVSEPTKRKMQDYSATKTTIRAYSTREVTVSREPE